MKTKFIITLSFKFVINVLINYVSTLFDDRDFLFESELLINYNLDFDDDVFAHIVDFFIFFIQIRNFIKTSIIFFKNIRLNTIMKYAVNECY